MDLVIVLGLVIAGVLVHALILKTVVDTSKSLKEITKDLNKSEPCLIHEWILDNKTHGLVCEKCWKVAGEND